MRNPTITEIEAAVKNLTGLETIKSKSREEDIVYAKHLFRYLADKLTRYKKLTIGLTVGDKDHSTVHHSRKTIKDWYDTDIRVKNDVELLMNQLTK